LESVRYQYAEGSGPDAESCLGIWQLRTCYPFGVMVKGHCQSLPGSIFGWWQEPVALWEALRA
jgi:hypothetical protein